MLNAKHERMYWVGNDDLIFVDFLKDGDVKLTFRGQDTRVVLNLSPLSFACLRRRIKKTVLKVQQSQFREQLIRIKRRMEK